MSRKDARVNTVVFLHLVFLVVQLNYCSACNSWESIIVFYKRIFLRHVTEKNDGKWHSMFWKWQCSSQVDILKKTWTIFMIENKGTMRTNGYWTLSNLFCVWHSGNMTSYGNNSELSWNFPKVLLILKSRVVNYIM